MTIEFQAWPKTPRLFRGIVVTEKIDGTNSAIIIEPASGTDPALVLAYVEQDEVTYEVAAQSRNRIITPGKTTDNHGFAQFVQRNAEELVEILGPGRHFGEWWGAGIQNRYKFMNVINARGFALFNTGKWEGLHTWLEESPGRQVLLETVPVLYQGTFSEEKIRAILDELEVDGSQASPTDKAEGIVVFHTQSRQTYKYTIDNNDAAKGNN